MRQLKLKGFVTPADCGGDLQKALDTAAQLDIRKVVIEEDCTAPQPLIVPANMYILIKNCVLTGDLIFDGCENWSFCKKWLTVEGENGTLRGDLTLFNADHVNVTGLTLEGQLSCEYANWVRLQELAGTVKIGRGCTNFIVQHVTAQTLYVCGDWSCGRIVPGSKPEVTNIVVQNCKANVQLGAAADCGLLNVHADHIDGTVKVGCPNTPLPPEQFMNLTLTHITGGVELYNPTKHAYIR